MRRGLSLLPAAMSLWGATSASAQSQPDFEQPPVSYSATTPRDAIATLQNRIAAGDRAFVGNDRRVLESLLEALGVSVESQLLVFSRTSLQRGRIRPEHPRALYFSDSVYVGWVPGGLIEVTAIDPELGPVFYSFDPAAARAAAPKFERDADCLRCHGGTFVREIPGLLARSVFPDAGGEPLGRHGSTLVNDETPFGQRWGGWYVSGYHGPENHRGNARGSEQGERLIFETSSARPDELSDFFETSNYLRPTSDVVALLVFEHQVTVQNALTHAGMKARRMMAYQQGLQKAFKEPVTEEPAFDSVKSVFASEVEAVLDRLLFRNAASLPAGVKGADAFRLIFAQGAPRSPGGHALKDLQLQDRLFTNRCSFLIYSDAFRALPPTLQSRIFDRLRTVLSGTDPRDRYAYLGAEEKQRIYEILKSTCPPAMARWRDLESKERVGAAP